MGFPGVLSLADAAGWGVENSLMELAGDLGRESAISSVQLCVRESPLFDQLFKPV